MNQRFLNDFKRDYVDSMARFDGFNGHIKLADNFTKETARCLVEICLWLRENGYKYSTEVKMKGLKRRADIVVPELFGSQVIEIHDTEDQLSLFTKHSDYLDVGVTMLAVPAYDPGQAIFMIRRENGLLGVTPPYSR